MLKFNNSIMPNKVHIGWHFSSKKYAYRDVYSTLKSSQNGCKKHSIELDMLVLNVL